MFICSIFVTHRCPLEGSFGVGAPSSVVDGWDLLVEQGTLVLVGLGGRDVVHPSHDVGLGREGDQRHPSVLRRHGEVGQHLADEPQLAEEIVGTHAGGLVHEEDQVQAEAFLAQLADVLLERLAQALRLALRALRQVARRRGPRRRRYLRGPAGLKLALRLVGRRPSCGPHVDDAQEQNTSRPC